MMKSKADWQKYISNRSREFWGVVASWIASLLYLLLQGGRMAMMLFILISLLCIYFLAVYGAGVSIVQGSRKIRKDSQTQTLQAGKSLSVKIRVQLAGFLPVPYIWMKDKLISHDGQEHVFEHMLLVDSKRRGESTYTTPPLQRGTYQFQSIDCCVQDIFGLFKNTRSFQLKETVRVMPATVPIANGRLPFAMEKGNRSVNSKGLQRETTQINGVRDYVYGDRLSRVHWNATARTGSWKSKEFERESSPKIMVVLDCIKQNYQDNEQFELAVSIAASLIQFASKENREAGLLILGAFTHYQPPANSKSTYEKILDHLIDVKADGDMLLSEGIKASFRYPMANTHFMLITPHEGEDLVQAALFVRMNQAGLTHIGVECPQERAFSMQEKRRMKLQAMGIVSYSVSRLEELPLVLGGKA